jgi:O-antigen/teichoic acid export membrane protein
VADQAVSSVANFVLGIVVARSLGAEGFGAFSLAYLTYAFVLSAGRGLATDPLTVRFSGARPDAWRRAVAAAGATGTSVGLVAGAGCVAVGLLHGNEVGDAFVAMGVLLPALMLQDSWRFAFFAAGRPAQALANDLVWTLLLLGALVVLITTERGGVVPYVIAFGGTAAVAAVFGLLQTRIVPRPTAIPSWVRTHRALGGRYLVENLSIGAAGQARFLVLGGVAGLQAVGEVRAAEILMGPFMVLLMGISQVAVPEAVAVLRRAPHHLGRFCLVLGGGLAGVALAWGLAVLHLLPESWGGALIGELWVPAEDLFPLVMTGLVVTGLVVGAQAGLRALGAAPRSLAAQLTNAGLYAVGGTVGAILDGARGSCWGVVVAVSCGAVVWWWQLRRGLAEHLAAHVDEGPGGRPPAQPAGSPTGGPAAPAEHLAATPPPSPHPDPLEEVTP